MKRKAKQKPPGKCIFCAGGNLSKEHFWSQWASALLPGKNQGPHAERFRVHIRKTDLVSDEIVDRTGHVTTKKLRIVCVSCNSGWMSAIENDVSKFAVPLVRGEATNLTADQQTTLSQWVTLKAMLVEQNRRSNVVYTQQERDLFRTTRKIPDRTYIWITQCFSRTWCNAFERNASAMSWSNSIPKGSPGDGYEAHSVAFGIGELFVFLLGSGRKSVNLSDVIKPSEHFVPLWPLRAIPLQWPPSAAIGDRDANALAGAFEGLMRHPEVRWMDLK